MRIRKATPGDFEVYKSLFEDVDLSMLYNPKPSDIKPQTDTDAKNYWDFDEATLKQIDDFFKRTPEKFQKELEEFREYRIYMIEDKGSIVGIAELFRTGKSRWKLAELSIKVEYHTQETMIEIADSLTRQSSIKEMDVCTPYVSCEELLTKSGFVAIGGSFFRYSKQESQG